MMRKWKVVGSLGILIALFILAPISSINIFALPISNVIHSSIVCICALVKLGKLVKINYFEFLLPIISAVIMYMAIGFLQSAFGGIMAIIMSVLIGGVVYFLCAFPLVLEYSRQFFAKFRAKREQ